MKPAANLTFTLGAPQLSIYINLTTLLLVDFFFSEGFKELVNTLLDSFR
jgi:hypothetical protein